MSSFVMTRETEEESRPHLLDIQVDDEDSDGIGDLLMRPFDLDKDAY